MRLSLILLCFFVLVPGLLADRREDAARCLARRRTCSRGIARSSRVCKPNRSANRQPGACHRAACDWCKMRSKRNTYPCKVVNVRRICGRLAAGKPATRPPTTRRPPTRATTRRPPTRTTTRRGSGRSGARRCVWTGGNRVVVDVGSATPARGWSRITNFGRTGMIYEKDKWDSHKVDSASAATTMCYPVRANEPGDYFLTALTHAKHGTEFNDMWISSSRGMGLRKGSSVINVPPNQFRKAYQNFGKNVLADEIKTVDHQGYRFFIPDVRAEFKLCISGRSYQFEVFRLIIAKCGSNKCSSGFPFLNWKGLPLSTCL